MAGNKEATGKQTGSKTGRKREKRVITVTYANELQAGVFERALADIYARKVKSGTLVM